MYLNSISYIVCTYNGARTITNCLKAILKQQSIFDNRKSQLIIVANGCTDQTVLLTQKAINEYLEIENSFDILFFEEGNIGKSKSLELALENSSGTFIAIVDDDNYLLENWSSKAWALCSRPGFPGILGTSSILPIETELLLSNDFKTYLHHYAVGKQDTVLNKTTVWGAGCVFSHDVWKILKKNNFRYLLSGRRGNRLVAGEDSEFCHAAALCGYSIVTSNDLVLIHDVTPTRFSNDYLYKLIYSEGYAHSTLSLYQLLSTRSLINLRKLIISTLVNLSFYVFKFITFYILKYMKPKNLRFTLKFQFYSGAIAGLLWNIVNYNIIIKTILLFNKSILKK